MRPFIAIIMALAAFAYAPYADVHAQTKKSAPQTSRQAPAALDPYKLNIMIRSSIIALNQANRTGNYSVLLDLGSPAFRASNNSARLAQIFARLRQRNLDLSPILFFTPKLFQQPQLLPNGILNLKGYFPTSPERVNFNLYFQRVGRDWLLYGIGVSTTPADVTAAIPSQSKTGQGRKGQPVQKTAPRAAAPKSAAVDQRVPVKRLDAPTPSRRSASRVNEVPEGDADEPRKEAEGQTSANAVRIDLSKERNKQAEGPADGTTPDAASPQSGEASSSFWNTVNPFAPN